MQYADIDSATSVITITMDLDCSYADLLYNRKFQASQQTKRLLLQILEEYEKDDVFSSRVLPRRLWSIPVSSSSQVRSGALWQRWASAACSAAAETSGIRSSTMAIWGRAGAAAREMAKTAGPLTPYSVN